MLWVTTMTTPRFSRLGFVSLLTLGSLVTACGADDGTTPGAAPVPVPTTTATTEPKVPEPECPASQVCAPPGMPFVRVVLADSDAADPERPQPGETTAVLSNPEAGKICMSGRLQDGYAFLTLGFARWDGMNLRDPLDAAGLGIARIQFMLSSPPQTGVYVQLASLVPDCDRGPLECQHWGFFLNSNTSRTPWLTNQSQTVNAPLADFVRAAHIDSTWQFDPSRLSTLQIGPGAFGSVTGDYSYCVSNLKFLDAAGNEVLPRP